MGNCLGSSNLTPEELERRKKNKLIDSQMKAQSNKEAEKVKLLLLGAGESGKSTIFKQMKLIYGNRYTESECKKYIPTIHANILQTIHIFLHHLKEYNYYDEIKQVNELKILEETLVTSKIDEELGNVIKIFWNDDAVQKLWSKRSEFQIVGESVVYFVNRIDIIANENYVPSQDDILNSRVKTTGIVTEGYTIDGTAFEMYDVGGQRNERKKWIHCFEGVTAVIFVAALSEFDMKLYEDGSTNRMVEALELFDDICNNTFFKTSSMILFLNKKDLFEQKIKSKSIADSEAFKDYKGAPNSYDDGVKYFIQKFLEKNKSGSERNIYQHVTCATDTKNVKVVFNACKDIILQENLAKMGIA